MKIRSIAFAALAALSGQAFALTPAQVADAATVKVYMSGASALRNVIGGLFTQHCESDLDVYYSGVGTFGGTAFSANGDAHRVYTCTMKAASPILAGKKVALFKSDIGGSGQGVFPVYFGGAEGAMRSFLSVSTCGSRSASVPNYVCSGEQQQVPMAGVSDVEPGMFKGINTPTDDPNYPQDGLSDSQLAELTISPLFQTVFGVAVNKSLRDALQTKQGLTAGSDADADRPSLSMIEAASYFGGLLGDPSTGMGWQAVVSAADAKKATRVNVCRRVQGSGTQAAANAQLSGFPCNASGGSVADKSFSDAGLANAVGSVGASGKLFVFEGSSTGNVISCLGAAEDNAAYAIGHVSKENDEAGSKWRHVKLDGIAPNRDNVKAGKYAYFYESTMQWHNGHVATLSTDQQDFIAQFAAEAGKPESLNKLSTATKNGVAALPDSYAGAYGTGTADEIAFGSRVTRGGNSCAVPFIAK
ncbi:MAG: hypothetical protein KBC73_08430 [Burkholderiaceae bacterium]|nr:hypothetical protein [Burkholderiaceae bacterium]